MARHTVQIVTCDICNEEGAQAFVLAAGPKRGRGEGRELDLCAEHAAPIEALLEEGRKIAILLDGTAKMAAARRPTRGARTKKIYTPEELDRLEKKEQR